MDEPQPQPQPQSQSQPQGRPRQAAPVAPGPECPPPVADTEGFAGFYRAFMPRLVAFLRYQGVPLQDAADIAQDTMFKACGRWSSIAAPQAWTKRVASRAWGRRLAGLTEDPVADLPEPLLTCTDVADWEQRHDILRILDALPLRQRQVLAWTLDGHTPGEIAVELHLPPETVRANLYKARRAVAKHLEERS